MSDDAMMAVKCTVTIQFLDNGETIVTVSNPDGINNMRIDKATKMVRRKFRQVRGQIRFDMKARERAAIAEAAQAVKSPLPDVLVGEEHEDDLSDLDDFLSFDDVHGDESKNVSETTAKG